MEAKENNYKPLIVLISAILLASAALEYSSGAGKFMDYFMGLFFLMFAMFKFFDLNGFANGFSMYDLITKKFRGYAYIYAFLELSLGLLYLSGKCPVFTNSATIILMTVSAAGVVSSIRKGMNIKCACLGTVLNVPLSTVSVVENVGMGLMAAIMLANHL